MRGIMEFVFGFSWVLFFVLSQIREGWKSKHHCMVARRTSLTV